MSQRAVWSLGLSLLLSSGCMPSKEAMSAGAVGCGPDEIEVSDEVHHGVLVQTADTWTATCRGRTFVCTKVSQSSEKGEGLSGLFASNVAAEQVTCTEEAETPQEQENREARHLARLRQAATPQAAPSKAPEGAAGFEFGMSAGTARERCEITGNQWAAPNGAPPTCSGAAAPLGVPATVALRFCNDRTCSITIEHRPSAGWSSNVVSIKGKLESKYGAPQSLSRGIPERCRADAAFARCLETRELELRFTWRWPSGETVDMSVGKPTPAAPAAIRLVYTRSGSPVDVSAL